MKNMFFEHIMKENGNIEEVLNNSIIILDTNALLMLYRLNIESRKKYFDVLSKVKERLFLTNQSVKEFFDNRLIICDNKFKLSSSVEDELIKDLDKIKNKVRCGNFNNNSASLITHESTLQNEIIECIDREINEIKKKLGAYEVNINKDFISNDEILKKILELFEGKVNESFSEEDLEKIYVNGKDRYEEQIPPGYKDNKKEGNDIFGDLIIWKEIIEIAKREDKNILFVSDDRKDDWCEKFKGQDLGPRKELIREFYKLTKKLFYSVTTTNFIRSMSDIYKVIETESLQKQSEIIVKNLEKKIVEKEELNRNEKYLSDEFKERVISNLLEKKYLTEKNIINNIKSVSNQNKNYLLSQLQENYFSEMDKLDSINDISNLEGNDRLRENYLGRRKSLNSINDISDLEENNRLRENYLGRRKSLNSINDISNLGGNEVSKITKDVNKIIKK